MEIKRWFNNAKKQTIAMKKIISFHLLLFSLIGGYSQNKNDIEVYKQVFEELQSTIKDTLVIEVGSNPSKLMLEDLKFSKILTAKQLRKIESKINQNYVPSENLNALLSNIVQTSPMCKEDGTYTKRFYSKPFYISKKTAIIFLSFAVKNKKYEGGKGIGSNIVEFYKNNGNTWLLHKREVFSSF